MMDLVARTPKQLGNGLRRRRKALALSQAELAARISLRQATVSDLEIGEKDALVSTLMEVLAALELELVLRPRRRMQAEDLGQIF